MRSPEDRLREIFLTALEFKQMQLALYAGALRACSGEAATALFAFLLEQVSARVGCFGENLGKISGGATLEAISWGLWDRRRAENVRTHTCADCAAFNPGPEEIVALEGALGIERTMIKYYHFCLEDETDPAVRVMIREIISEERNELDFLTGFSGGYGIGGG
ncbi:MAG: hypothetical protein LLG06_18270 [Desulfobacteraceae bacterium]|nr:hypothetical protein [Desulfobacteraceae bacterium]